MFATIPHPLRAHPTSISCFTSQVSPAQALSASNPYFVPTYEEDKPDNQTSPAQALSADDHHDFEPTHEEMHLSPWIWTETHISDHGEMDSTQRTIQSHADIHPTSTFLLLNEDKPVEIPANNNARHVTHNTDENKSVFLLPTVYERWNPPERNRDSYEPQEWANFYSDNCFPNDDDYDDDVAGHDLAGHNLAGHNLAGHNLAGHNLDGHDLDGHKLAGHNLAGHDLAGHNLAGNNLAAGGYHHDHYNDIAGYDAAVSGYHSGDCHDHTTEYGIPIADFFRVDTNSTSTIRTPPHSSVSKNDPPKIVKLFKKVWRRATTYNSPYLK